MPAELPRQACAPHIPTPAVWCLLLLGLSLAGCGRSGTSRTATQLLDEGWNRYSLGNFDLAQKAFAQAAAKPGISASLRLQALYGQATTLQWRKPDPDPVGAAELYERVAAQDPDSDLAAWSLLALARMQYVLPSGQQCDAQAVAAAYQRVIDRYPHHQAGEQAFLSLQALRLEDNDAAAARQVLAALDEFLAGHPQSHFLSTAYTLRAHSYRLLDRPRERLDNMIQSLNHIEVDPRNPALSLATTYWQIASTAEFDLGDFDTARRYYHKLIAEYPTDQKNYLSQLQLENMDQVEARIRREGATPKTEAP
jgi:outer membrane protein assembly factor BamD (BamD/ComL family)